MTTSRHPTPVPPVGKALPRRLRWLQPLLALAGLGSLPPGVPARTVDAAPAIERVQALRARLLAADAGAASGTAAKAQAPAAPQVAQWQKWNDWNNWAKWGNQ